MKNIIELKKASKVYSIGDIKVHALNEVSLTIPEGELVVILGPSGAGKTTILNLLGGMDFSTSGQIIIDDQEISSFSSKQLTLYRRHKIGFVFQFYNLMPNLTALENIELAVEICKDAYNPSEILNNVGLSERANNFPSQLSGGEQQRISIARAIAKNPKILLCDEPTGALDYKTGKSILKLLQDLSKKENKTLIIVTHNSALKEMADRVIMMKNGTITNIIVNDSPKSVEEIEW